MRAAGFLDGLRRWRSTSWPSAVEHDVESRPRRSVAQALLDASGEQPLPNPSAVETRQIGDLLQQSERVGASFHRSDGQFDLPLNSWSSCPAS